MVFIDHRKARYLIPRKVGKKIVFIPLNKFYDYLDYVEKDVTWQLSKMKD